MKNRQTMVMILLVITVVVYFAVDIAYRLIELSTPAPEPEPQAATGAPAVDMTKDPLEAYAVIVDRNLFRTTDRPIAVDQMDPNSLEATTLQLDLYGTIAGEDGRGYAIIEERDKKRQRLYKVGDKVGGATIVKIARNAVVLRMGERDQVLKKKEIASAGSNRQARTGAACALETGETISHAVFSQFLDVPRGAGGGEQGETAAGGEYAAAVGRFEGEYFRTLLRKSGGNVEAAATEAGINLATMYRKMKKHGIRREEFS